jgi:magnesium transporter
MVNTYEHKGLVWIDLERPTRDEVQTIMKQYDLHPLVGEELLLPSLRPKVDLYPGYIYMILLFPTYSHSHKGVPEQEIDFIIGKNFLITTRFDTIDPVHRFSKVFEVNSILDRTDIGEHAGFIFFYMIHRLYASVDHELNFIADTLRVIEGRIFSGREVEMVKELSEVSRKLLHFKQALSSHRQVLESFSTAALKFFGENFSPYSKGIVGTYYRTGEAVVSNLEFFNELRETNDSLLSTKQNETMRILTTISFITFPLALVVDLFGLGAEGTPLLDHPYSFGIIFGSVLGMAFLMFMFFRYKRWL